MRVHHLVAAAALVLAGAGRVGAATITGPVNPPPGGYTFSATGSANVGTGTGRTWNYTALDQSLYDDLYWGLTTLQAPFCTAPAGSTTQGTSGAILSLSGNVAQVTFASPWCIDLAGFPDPCNTVRYTVTASTGTFVTASSIPGLTGAELFVLPVTGSSFSVTQLFEVKIGSSWFAVNDYFNTLDGTQPGSAVGTSVQGNFWDATTPVPEPTSLLLLGSGLLAAGSRARRRRA